MINTLLLGGVLFVAGVTLLLLATDADDPGDE